MASEILVVDDEVDIRDLVAGILEDEGHETRTAGDSDSALAALRERRPGLVFLDIWLQGSRMDGLSMLDIIRREYPDLAVVIISGHGNIETAVSAIRRGAYDYIEKPFKADKLVHIAERALETSSLKKEVRDLKARSVETSQMIGNSAAVQQTRQALERVAPTNSRILITGPSGSGKELVGREIHRASHRADRPFLTASIAGLDPTEMEISLFGNENPDGSIASVGLLEEAHGGTVYLDEIAAMSSQLQNRMVRFLVESSFLRRGGKTRVKVDIRVVSATSRDLASDIEKGVFREDLFHRLCVVPLKMPPLEDRREDIPELVNYFMQRYAETSGLAVRTIADDAMAVLQAHDWPGNIRQLRNNVERLMILTQDDPDAMITADMLPSEVGAFLPDLPNNEHSEHIMSLPLREAREIFERDYLKAQINRFGGNISKTAEYVGMERSALHRKLKSLGL